MMIKGDTMNKNVIYNMQLRTKAESRAAAEKEVKAFLRKGGVIKVDKPQRNPKTFMSAKSSRGYLGGTSGFAIGFPRKVVGIK
jgi:hypothetical protein